MKNIKLIILIFILVLCLTGCGNSKIIVDGKEMTIEDLKKEYQNTVSWGKNYYQKDIEYTGIVKKVTSTKEVYYRSFATFQIGYSGDIVCKGGFGNANFITFEDGVELWVKDNTGFENIKIGDKLKVKSKIDSFSSCSQEFADCDKYEETLMLISSSLSEENKIKLEEKIKDLSLAYNACYYMSDYGYLFDDESTFEVIR